MADVIRIEKGRTGRIEDLDQTFPTELKKDDFIIIKDSDGRRFYHYEENVAHKFDRNLPVKYDIVEITQPGEPGRPIVIDIQN
jgi:hypothetical protein